MELVIAYLVKGLELWKSISSKVSFGYSTCNTVDGPAPKKGLAQNYNNTVQYIQ